MWEVFNITLFLTKPVLEGKRTYLTKKTFHSFLNHRPIITQNRKNSVFFEIYGEFKVAEKAMPFAIMHFETE